MNSDTLVIVNPASSGGRTLRRWPVIHRALRDAGLDPDVHLTGEPREAITRTREAIAEGYRFVVGVGGDGTVNELINGYLDESGRPVDPAAAIGLIPSGTGGDFRRTTGLTDVGRAIAAVARRRTVAIDAGRIEIDDAGAGSPAYHHFLNIADWGVGGEVVARVNVSRLKAGGLRGTAVFLGISLSELLTYGTRPVHLVLDDVALDADVSNVVVANGRYFGGGMRIAPHARLDDGLFDVILVEGMSRLRTIGGVPKIYRGRHMRMPGISAQRARRVRIEPRDSRPLRFEAEGELIGIGAATVTCLGAVVRLIV